MEQGRWPMLYMPSQTPGSHAAHVLQPYTCFMPRKVLICSAGEAYRKG